MPPDELDPQLETPDHIEQPADADLEPQADVAPEETYEWNGQKIAKSVVDSIAQVSAAQAVAEYRRQYQTDRQTPPAATIPQDKPEALDENNERYWKVLDNRFGFSHLPEIHKYVAEQRAESAARANREAIYRGAYAITQTVDRNAHHFVPGAYDAHFEKAREAAGEFLTRELNSNRVPSADQFEAEYRKILRAQTKVAPPVQGNDNVNKVANQVQADVLRRAENAKNAMPPGKGAAAPRTGGSPASPAKAKTLDGALEVFAANFISPGRTASA